MASFSKLQSCLAFLSSGWLLPFFWASIPVCDWSSLDICVAWHLWNKSCTMDGCFGWYWCCKCLRCPEQNIATVHTSALLSLYDGLRLVLEVLCQCVLKSLVLKHCYSVINLICSINIWQLGKILQFQKECV